MNVGTSGKRDGPDFGRSSCADAIKKGEGAIGGENGSRKYTGKGGDALLSWGTETGTTTREREQDRSASERRTSEELEGGRTVMEKEEEGERDAEE